MKQYGFVPDTIGEEHYILGGFSKIKGEILQPDGQWGLYIPRKEYQRKNGVETMNCTSFGTLNCLETLFKRKFGIEYNFSDRYVGIMAETTPAGNSPHKVIETIRKDSGLIPEKELPFHNYIYSWGDYYSPNPMFKSLLTIGQHFLHQYDIKHEWVFKGSCTPEKLMEALKYSPLGVSVEAWIEGKRGYYVKNGSDNHWCMLYGYREGEYWVIFDTYDNTMKKLVWDYDFGFAKRYCIEKAKPQKHYWFTQLFINLFK